MVKQFDFSLKEYFKAAWTKYICVSAFSVIFLLVLIAMNNAVDVVIVTFVLIFTLLLNILQLLRKWRILKSSTLTINLVTKEVTFTFSRRDGLDVMQYIFEQEKYVITNISKICIKTNRIKILGDTRKLRIDRTGNISASSAVRECVIPCWFENKPNYMEMLRLISEVDNG